MSGKARKPARYFDSCIYLAYLRNEIDPYGKEKIAAIEAMWKDSERGGLTVVTSTITITEVLTHKLDATAKKKFVQATESGLHICIDVEPPIALKARDYRDYYQMHPVKDPHVPGKTRKHLSTPDALHLATAFIYGCEELLTFDGFGKKEQDNTIGLLWLGNKAGQDDLIITQPYSLEPATKPTTPKAQYIQPDIFDPPPR